MDEGVELHGSPDGTVAVPEAPEPPAAPVPPTAASSPEMQMTAPVPAVEDLFADVSEPAEGSSVTPTAMPLSSAAPSNTSKSKFILLIVGIVVILGAIGAGAWFVLSGSKGELNVPVVTPPVKTEPAVTQEVPVEPVVPNDKLPEEVPVVVEELDSDADGLTDAEEIRYGTKISKPDSDSDGLFDREEVVLYRTNPLVADTDGDGFLDGAEVQSGYDPNGPGRLNIIPE